MTLHDPWSSVVDSPSFPDDDVEDLERLMKTGLINRFVSPVHRWSDIRLPTRAQSLYLIESGRVWTSWVHCSVYHPDFEEQHEEFWNELDSGKRLEYQPQPWMAIYFALLAVSM